MTNPTTLTTAHVRHKPTLRKLLANLPIIDAIKLPGFMHLHSLLYDPRPEAGETDRPLTQQQLIPLLEALVHDHDTIALHLTPWDPNSRVSPNLVVNKPTTQS